MKRLLFPAILIFAASTSCWAQKISADKVPPPVKQAFTKSHPGTAVKWEMENGKYEAGFKTNKTNMSELYTAAGVMEEIEADIEVSKLPTSVLTYVNDNYKGQKIKEGSKITKANGTVIYEAEVGKKDVMFDANGKFLKEVKE